MAISKHYGFQVGPLSLDPSIGQPSEIATGKLPDLFGEPSMASSRKGTAIELNSKRILSLAEINRSLIECTSTSVHLELLRSESVQGLVSKIQQLVASKIKMGSKFDASKTISSLFPAFVFESLSAANEVTSEIRERFNVDVLLPCGELLPQGASFSVSKRLQRLLHDFHGPKANIQEIEKEAWKMSKEISDLATEARADFRRKCQRVEGVSPQVTCSVKENSKVIFKCGPFAHEILWAYYLKLKRLFDAHCCCKAIEKTADEKVFHEKCFVMLQRYFALTGMENPEGESGWQGAIPPICFNVLSCSAELVCECFASPLNATSPFFCSAFPDTDAFFGSVGSFFNLGPCSGTYEANPPFDHTVALNMAKHMIEMLKRNVTESDDLPLSFYVVMPYADKGKVLTSMKPVFDMMEQSGFLTHTRLVAASDAPFVDGYQQCKPGGYFVARLDTMIFVMQNAAANRARDTDSVLKEFCDQWKSLISPRKRPRE